MPLKICFVLQFPLYLAILFSKSVRLNTGLGFFLGMTCVARYNGCYINISEYVHTSYKNAVSTLLLIFDSLTNILIALYFRSISKNWLWL